MLEGWRILTDCSGTGFPSCPRGRLRVAMLQQGGRQRERGLHGTRIVMSQTYYSPRKHRTSKIPNRYQKNRFSGIQRNWQQRILLVVAVAISLPFLSSIFHIGSGGGHHEHRNLLSEAKVGEPKDHAMSKHFESEAMVILGRKESFSRFAETQSSMLIVLFLMLMTLGFEFLKDSIDENFEKHALPKSSK